jgi:hypothetical protein
LRPAGDCIAGSQVTIIHTRILRLRTTFLGGLRAVLPFLTAPQRAAAFSGPDFGYAELDIPNQAAASLWRSWACLMSEASCASITHAQVIAIWVKVIRDNESRGHLCPAAFAFRTFHCSTSAASRRGMDLPWIFFRWHSCSIQPPCTAVNIGVDHNRACFFDPLGPRRQPGDTWSRGSDRAAL